MVDMLVPVDRGEIAVLRQRFEEVRHTNRQARAGSRDDDLDDLTPGRQQGCFVKLIGALKGEADGSHLPVSSDEVSRIRSFSRTVTVRVYPGRRHCAHGYFSTCVWQSQSC